MFIAHLADETDFDGWRKEARRLCAARIEPSRIRWQVAGAAESLFDQLHTETLPRESHEVRAPKAFIAQAETAVCHRDTSRFDQLYQLLWRMQSDRHLLDKPADKQVYWLAQCVKAINRDVHKMHAFVRFRKVAETSEGREQFAAWFEPEHRITTLGAPFFQRRFPNMDWVIVTPERSAIWDGKILTYVAGGARQDVPAEDAVEDQWRVYFSSIFNPARVKVKAMTAEMPKKYWKNLPEAELIPGLLAGAQAKVQSMRDTGVTEMNPKAVRLLDRLHHQGDGEIVSLADARRAVQTCQKCPLHCNASQAVFGEGPDNADLMLVGEQPGDQEDIAGRPFVGPAGQLLDRSLKEAELVRSEAYVTNAVKHFKHELRGKRRMHARPNASEIDTCRWWLDIERQKVSPRLIVALGASAARGVTGKTLRISDIRGEVIETAPGERTFFTIHPSYILRLPDPGRQAEEIERFNADLAFARTLLNV